MARPNKIWFRKDTGWWMVTVDGKKTRLSQGKENRKAAQEKFHGLKAVQARPADRSDARVADLIESFLAWSKVHRSSETNRNHIWYGQKFAESCGYMKATEVRPIHVTQFVDGRSWGPTSILIDAVTKPGVISTAYSRFWSYSVGNQLLALFQCLERHLDPGPINTFHGWIELGRHVKKGEKALTLCMPVTVKRKPKAPDNDETTVGGDGAERRPQVQPITHFVYRPHWFVLCQTEGKDYQPTALPEWNESVALAALMIDRVPFQHADGNAQGYAADRTVAVSPIAFMPHRTLFHEMAHVILGHTEELRRMDDGQERTPRSLREVEAESVAMICCESLGLAGAEFSRGYIQHWITSDKIPERSAQRVFNAADQILKAGRPSPDTP